MFQCKWEVEQSGYEWKTMHRREMHIRDKAFPGSEPCLVLTPRDKRGGRRRYHPLQDQSGLFRTFAATLATPEGIREFANQYGELGQPFSQDRVYEMWATEILCMRFAITLWEGLREGCCTYSGVTLEWQKEGHGVLDTAPDLSERERETGEFQSKEKYLGNDSSYNIHLHYKENIEPILHVKFHLIESDPRHCKNNSWIILSYIRMVIAFRIYEICPSLNEAEQLKDLRLSFVPRTLLSALWLQFATAVTHDKHYRPCRECGVWFELSPGLNRADRQLCSDACRMRSYRKRRKSRQNKIANI